MFAFHVVLGGLGADGETAQVLYSAVSGNYFPALGLQPAGRLFRNLSAANRHHALCGTISWLLSTYPCGNVLSVQQKAGSRRLFRLLLPVYFLSSVVVDWRSEGWLWLAIMLLLGLASLLEFFRPEATSPKQAQIAIGLLVVLLFAAGGWRHFSSSSPSSKNNAIATTLKVTPAHGARGQTLTVTISAISVNFNEASRPNFGPDVRVLTNQLINATTVQAEIQIAPEAPLGRRRIWISTPGGQTAIDDTPTGLFQVDAAASPEK